MDEDFRPKILAIASSTGGPEALAYIFRQLTHKLFMLPIVITQHMPEGFTYNLAKKLEKYVGEGRCQEGKDGLSIQPGHVYIAPGNYHMEIMMRHDTPTVRLNQNDFENFCRPAADPMFRSLAPIYGEHCLALVLTGMGQDGKEGACTIAKAGGVILTQDEASSVVWGMPGAVVKAGLSHKTYNLNEIPGALLKLCRAMP